MKANAWASSSRILSDGLRDLCQRFNEGLAQFVPRKRIKLGRSKPWYTMELNQLRKRKEKAHWRWKNNRENGELEEEYTNIKKEYNRLLKKTKKEHASKVAEKIDGLKGRPWWKEVDRALGRSSKHAIPPINDGPVTVSDTKDKTEIFEIEAKTPVGVALAKPRVCFDFFSAIGRVRDFAVYRDIQNRCSRASVRVCVCVCVCVCVHVCSTS